MGAGARRGDGESQEGGCGGDELAGGAGFERSEAFGLGDAQLGAGGWIERDAEGESGGRAGAGEQQGCGAVRGFGNGVSADREGFQGGSFFHGKDGADVEEAGAVLGDADGPVAEIVSGYGNDFAITREREGKGFRFSLNDGEGDVLVGGDPFQGGMRLYLRGGGKEQRGRRRHFLRNKDDAFLLREERGGEGEEG